MAELTLVVEKKDLSGSSAARALRKIGRIPAIIYGGIEETMVSLVTKDLTKEYLKGGLESKMVTLDFGKKQIKAITRSVQLHPVTDQPVHVDFQEITDNKMIKISIKVKVINEDKCPGIKRGGVLNMVYRKIAFRCSSQHIVPIIEIDLSGLEIGRSIHINDLKLSEELKPIDKSNFVLVSISGRAEDKEVESVSTSTSK